MPTYEYHCDACNHEFEEFQSMSEAALTKCPECGKKKLRRLFGTGVVAGLPVSAQGFYRSRPELEWPDAQFLVTALANRNHQPAGVLQLVQQGSRDFGRARSDRNGVVRRQRRIAHRAVGEVRRVNHGRDGLDDGAELGEVLPRGPDVG